MNCSTQCRDHEASESPVSGFQSIKVVVIFLVQCSFSHPVHKTSGKQLRYEAVEPGDGRHVQRKAVGGHPTDYPGSTSCAEKCLEK